MGGLGGLTLGGIAVLATYGIASARCSEGMPYYWEAETSKTVGICSDEHPDDSGRMFEERFRNPGDVCSLAVEISVFYPEAEPEPGCLGLAEDNNPQHEADNPCCWHYSYDCGFPESWGYWELHWKFNSLTPLALSWIEGSWRDPIPFDSGPRSPWIPTETRDTITHPELAPNRVELSGNGAVWEFPAISADIDGLDYREYSPGILGWPAAGQWRRSGLVLADLRFTTEMRLSDGVTALDTTTGSIRAIEVPVAEENATAPGSDGIGIEATPHFDKSRHQAKVKQ